MFRYLVALLSFAAMVTQSMRVVPAIVIVGTAAGTIRSQPSLLDEPAFAGNEPTSKEVGSTGAIASEKEEAKLLSVHPLTDGEIAIEQKSEAANFASSVSSPTEIEMGHHRSLVSFDCFIRFVTNMRLRQNNPR